MQLNYELIKEILKDIEKQSNGQNTVQIKVSVIQCASSQEQIDYHLQILEDDALIDVQCRLDGAVGTTMINRLTAEGHRVLEAMRNDTIWNKLKGGALGVGKEALRQAPALFIQMALAGAK